MRSSALMEGAKERFRFARQSRQSSPRLEKVVDIRESRSKVQRDGQRAVAGELFLESTPSKSELKDDGRRIRDQLGSVAPLST